MLRGLFIQPDVEKGENAVVDKGLLDLARTFTHHAIHL